MFQPLIPTAILAYRLIRLASVDAINNDDGTDGADCGNDVDELTAEVCSRAGELDDVARGTVVGMESSLRTDAPDNIAGTVTVACTDDDVVVDDGVEVVSCIPYRVRTRVNSSRTLANEVSVSCNFFLVT
jgi:hypothetical protein